MHFVGERGGSGGWWCCTGGVGGVAQGDGKVFFFWLGSGQLLGWGDLHCIAGVGVRVGARMGVQMGVFPVVIANDSQSSTPLPLLA